MESNPNCSQQSNPFASSFTEFSNSVPKNNTLSIYNNPFANTINQKFNKSEQLSIPNYFSSSNFPSTEKNKLIDKNFYLAPEKSSVVGISTFPLEMKQYKRTKMTLPEIDYLNISESCKFLYEDFQCVICHTLVKISNPKECSSCFKIFCGECLDTWLLSNDKCPCCRSLSTSRKISNKTLINILNKLEVTCNLCKNIYRLAHFSSHYTTCEKGLYECLGKDCNFKAHIETMEEHVTICQKVEERCNLCNLNVPRNYKKIHYESQCLGMEVKCISCKTSMKRKDFNEEHTKDKCLYIQLVKKDNEIAELRSQVEKLSSIVLNKNEKFSYPNSEETNKNETSEKLNININISKEDKGEDISSTIEKSGLN
jgi:hypothetical protein